MSDTETKTTQKTTKPRSRWALPVVLAVGLLAGLSWAAWKSFHISGPHRVVKQSRAVLSPEVVARIELELKKRQPKRMSAAISRAADITDELLSPGAGSPADARNQPLEIGLGGRGANSSDYAHTFAKVVETYLNGLGVNHRVLVIESSGARVLGFELGPRSWVYVQEHRSAVWLGHYVDPLLHDRFELWNVIGHVDEPVPVPKPGDGD